MYCRKNLPDLFSRRLDWTKLKFNVIYIQPLRSLHSQHATQKCDVYIVASS